MRRHYVLPTTPPIPDEDVNAARRMIARWLPDLGDRAEVERMLGVTA